MRRHAKASSAGSTLGQGSRPGSIRPAFAGRGASLLGGETSKSSAGRAALAILGFAVVVASAATPAVAAEACPNAKLRGENSSTHLPNCRAYEKVSPANKNGLNAVERGALDTDATGDHLGFTIEGTAPGSEAGFDFSAMRASRDPKSGWVAEPTNPPVPAGTGWTFATRSFSSQAEPKTLFLAGSALTPETSGRGERLYIRNNLTGSYELLTPTPGPDSASPVSEFQIGLPLGFGGASADFTHVLYETPFPQTSDTVHTKTYNPYEYVAGQGVHLVGILPDGSVAPNGARVGSGSASGRVRHSLSRDGTKAFFHATEPSEVGFNYAAVGQIYVRINGTETVHVSASQRTDCADHDPCSGVPEPDPAGPLPAFWLNAEAAHGDTTIFMSCEKLTNDSTAGSESGECSSRPREARVGLDLYLFDVNTGHLTDLTAADPSGANVLGIAGASEDLQRIYYVATGVEVPGSRAVPGQPNLYLWDHGTTKYLATLDANPNSIFGELGDQDIWSVSPASGIATVRVTPSGKHLAIASRAQLTSYDNSNPECYTGHCAEIYLYDLETGHFTCVSCNPSGEPPVGDAYFHRAAQVDFTSVEAPPRNLSEDGQRVFFQVIDALVTGDSNGKQDVYEWEGGVVHLISSGRDAFDSNFADASVNGDSAFFTTYDRLVTADTDNQIDLYDARVDGGFPGPPPRPPVCEGDACQSPPQPPNDPTPASASFSGLASPWAKAKRHHRGRHRNHKRRHRKQQGAGKHTTTKNG